MRSRYSAFSLSLTDYLIKTSHPSLHKKNEAELLRNTFLSNSYLSLRILATEINNNSGTVEFVAFYQTKSDVQQIHERSSFERTDSQWIYSSGVVLKNIEIKRNEKCWCGSDKKLKVCHKEMPL